VKKNAVQRQMPTVPPAKPEPALAAATLGFCIGFWTWQNHTR
jgi:hypothetical protein